jgi:hypothetical protein
VLPIPERIWSRLKLRLSEARAGSVTLWLDDDGQIISADFDHIPKSAEVARVLMIFRALRQTLERYGPPE